MPYELTIEGQATHAIDLVRAGDRATLTIDGRSYRGSLRPLGDAFELTLEDQTERLWLLVDRDTIFLHAFGRAWTASLVDPVAHSRASGAGGDVATAPMPGTVIRIAVAAGDSVAEGQTLVVIESMKMQSEIVAARAGEVARVLLEVGDTFDRGAPLVALVALDAEEQD